MSRDTVNRGCSVVVALVVLCSLLAQSQPLNAPDQRLVVGRLPCAPPGNPRSHGLRQLAWELMKRTSVEAEMESLEADVASPALFNTPLLLWCCDGPVAQLDQKAYANLRRFLVLGGFLLVDDPAAAPGGAFDRSVRQALERILPEKRPTPLNQSQVLFKTFFLIDRPAGRVLVRDPEGIQVGDRLAVLVLQNDLLGAISKDLYGNWEHNCEPGGELQREASFQLGINIVFYALCLDYKDDRVHLPFILRRRKL